MSGAPQARRLPTVVFLAISWLFVVGGCGYSTKRLEDLGGRTIAVKPFENLTFRRDLELRLTEHILTEIRGRTTFGIGTPQGADYVMEGTITAWEAVGLQRADRSVVQERFASRAHVILRDRRSGRAVKEFDVRSVTEYTPGSGGESLQGSAKEEVLRRLAIRVVQGLEPGIGAPPRPAPALLR